MGRGFAVGCRVIAFAGTILFTSALSAQVAPDSNQISPPNLTCSPAPCILPNVRVSKGPLPVGSSVIAINPNSSNQMLIGGEDFNCSSIQGFFSSNDGGSTWTHTCFPTFDGVGEPIIGYDLNSIAYGGGVQDWASIVLRSSSDNGVHWSDAKVVDGNGLGVYSPWLVVDTSPSSAFSNNIYVSSIHGGVYTTATGVHVSHSSDGGQHWRGRALDQWQSPDIDLFPHLSIGADGSLYETWLRCTSNGFGPCDKTGVPVLLSKSSDGGNSWTAAAVVAKVNLVPDNCLYGCLPNTVAGITNVPVSAVFGSGASAKVYVVFYNWTGTQMQVEVVTSSDGGNTFGAPVSVSSCNSGDQFLPWIGVADGGMISVTWLDRRNDPANLKYQPFFSTSSDGKTFSPSRPLSTTLSDPDVSFPVIEYRTNVWVGNTVYATWMDTRSGIARVELGGVQF
jgi:hypothetical protein